ncbi:TonB-dependent receptor [Luteimonas sp. MC1825]|uniref:TonB-dependent receptor plug domain-containing protein n=1 Tax=Luteimonas sp. MC1825 TaxID=2761107 RepID=UPI001622908B|nr:TonB-dependent receptor [Luteimonas sp. MC1825]MBB6599973.1 TonB-dependent receptor [Luteimonas sp. MC1825]QOC87679.1 TonB-dependent receptor [Luteimonas sp. MC1825]
MTPHPLAVALIATLAATALPAHAQTATPAERKATSLDTVIVTGTRASDRTAAESTAPIDLITPEALQSSGTTELATALSRLLPSLNFPRPAVSDGTDAVRPAQLRGLSPDHTLVLVNGKRYHTGALVNVNGTQGRSSSPVDLNTIPIAAIARVEVLRDGASAQYGSDAIAGVINIVLKGSPDGGSVSLRHGQTSAGDGAQTNLLADAGFPLGAEGGFVHLAVQADRQDQTDRARPFLGPATPTSAPLGRVVQRQGDPEVDSYSGSYNAELAASDSLTLYSHGLHTKRDILSNGFFRPAGDSRNIPSIYPDGFLPQINNNSTDYSFVGGLRKLFSGGTALDASYTYGSNELTFDIKNTLNRSLGPTSPTRFYAGALEVRQHILNLDMSTPLDLGLSSPLVLAYGAEYREDEFEQSPGEPDSYALGPFANIPGSQVFAGFKPSDGGQFKRDNISLYVSLEGDVTDKLSAGIAARYEDYSDFGDTSTGKLTARYDFTPTVALRGTLSTGFHAPSLQQQYFQSTATNFIVLPPPQGNTPFDIVTFRVTNPAGIALGAEPLRAEESTNFSLGLVLQPIDRLYITIDAYRIKLEDRITLSENLGTNPARPEIREFLNANGFPGVGGGRYFTNAIDTTTDGIDVIGTYGWQLGNGDLDLTVGYNHNKTSIDRIAPNPASLNAIDPTALRFGRVEIGRFEVGAPRDKFLLGGEWSSDLWNFSANAVRYGEITVRNANPAQDQTFDPKWTLALAATLKLDRWSFTLGGDNVLNEYPDENVFANSTGGQFPYASSAAPFGFNGAFVYGKIGYQW